MKLLLILAWFYCGFVKLDLGAFEGSLDQWIFMSTSDIRHAAADN